MEHDTPEEAHIGVDVSKGWLDAHELPSGRSRRFENSRKGFRAFRAWVGAGPVGLVLFEATGPYDRAFHAALGGGLPLCRVNAAWARHFRKSLGREAKTDRVDAALLAAMARARRDLRATPVRSEALRALEALWTARDALSRDRGRLKARSEQEAWQPYLKRRNAARLRWMDRELAGMDAETGRLLALDPGLSRRVEVLGSIPGIGPTVALALAVGMPELGAVGGREAASLAGVAPFANDSGARRGKRSIRGGRGRPRRKLFMAAMSAVRHNPEMRRLHEAMQARGKPKKVSLVAVMRRLVVLANTLLREDRLWTPAPPGPRALRRVRRPERSGGRSIRRRARGGGARGDSWAPVHPHMQSTVGKGNSKSSPPSSTITFFIHLREAWDIDEIHPFDIIGTDQVYCAQRFTLCQIGSGIPAQSLDEQTSEIASTTT